MSEVKLEWDFRELVENSNDIFIVVDRTYKIRYISSSVLKLYDIQPMSLLGQDIFNYVKADKVNKVKECLSGAISGQSYEFGLEFKKGFKTYFDVHVSYAHHEGAMYGFVLKLHDITKKKTKEQELIHTNKQLDQVIYKTTHDLKAPIMSALGLINLAEKAPVEQREEYLALIKRSLLKLNSFIEEMNNFFRNEKLALQREKISVRSLIQDEINDVKNLYHADKVRIEVKVDEVSEFFSDLVRVKTVFTNILTNAIKYADPGKNDPFIKVTAKVGAEFCEIAVADNGIGIDTEHLEKIFDLFHRATSAATGTGIGLFIVKDTIERLQGTIEVQSEIEKGTTFRMQIPNQLYQPAALN
ncbi:MAG TPA: PAS domain-containing sensor histidine kinase [Cyclobacteriaceae bacterium]|nr:PAS domain-containing sensor histidine kinase [Cyclobacteriaceae bacterium]